jgi:hypothetical protein
VIIGILDVGLWDTLGVNPAHEDLDCIKLTQEQREGVTRHLSYNWCGEHGTKMAGIAAAMTNNETGIAGICGGCKILDIESALETEPNGHDPHTCALGNVVNVSQFTYPIYYAASEFLDDGLRVLNMSYGSPGMATLEVLASWTAYVLGIAEAAPSTGYFEGGSSYPGSCSFVLGVGGAAQDGRFWNKDTSCHPNAGGFAGPFVDLVAPADPDAFSTNTIPYPGDADYYSVTDLSLSGATAQASGALGWLHMMADVLCDTRLILSPEDAIGILTATATPFEEAPQNYLWAGQGCVFGRGRLNLRGALRILEAGWCAEGGDIYTSHGVARYGDPTFEVTELTGRDFEANGAHWHVYEVTANVQLPCNGMADLPPFVAWARPRESTTRMYFQGASTTDEGILEIAGAATDCHMEIYGSTGRLKGYDFSCDVPGGQEFLVPLEDLRMEYTMWSSPGCEVPLAVDEAEPFSKHLSIRGTPGRPPFVIAVADVRGRPCDLSVYDVGGRRIASLLRGATANGVRDVAWDGKTDGGIRVAGGVYFAQLRVGAKRETVPIVIEGGADR